MKKILFTGATGFLGRNLVPKFKNKYEIFAPTRSELDLKNSNAVKSYIKQEQFDVIIHAAIPNLLSSQADVAEAVFKDSLQSFMNLYQMRDYYEKMLYFGSGAEFNKDRPIVAEKETNIGVSIPNDNYGLAKYIMNTLASSSQNIYNLRVFGCYGPTDAYFKLITYAIRQCLSLQKIELKQNCIFDYMYVDDLVPIIDYFIINTPLFHDYNVCTGVQTEIKEICELVKARISGNVPIQIEQSGFNNEYTGDNSRLIAEIENIKFTSLVDGIQKQTIYEEEVLKHEKTCS